MGRNCITVTVLLTACALPTNHRGLWPPAGTAKHVGCFTSSSFLNGALCKVVLLLVVTCLGYLLVLRSTCPLPLRTYHCVTANTVKDIHFVLCILIHSVIVNYMGQIIKLCLSLIEYCVHCCNWINL